MEIPYISKLLGRARRILHRFQTPHLSVVADCLRQVAHVIPSEGWERYDHFFTEPPATSLAAGDCRIDVWIWSADDATDAQWTFIISQLGRPYTWTLTFRDDHLLLATIGGKSGSNFYADDFSAGDRRMLALIRQGVEVFIRQAA